MAPMSTTEVCMITPVLTPDAKFSEPRLKPQHRERKALSSIDGSMAVIGRGAELAGVPEFKDPYEHRSYVLERLAGAFRVMARKGYCEGTSGHITVRDPVDPGTFWINPLGRHFGMMRVSDLVQVTMNGEIVGGNRAAINNAGYHIHSAIHAARPDVHAACHFHSIHGKAWSAFGKPLEMLNQDSCAFYNDQAVYAKFGAIALSAAQGAEIAQALGSKRVAILQNHGLLTTGETVDEAAALFTLMENTCRVQLLVEMAAANGIEKQICTDEEAAYTFASTTPEGMWLEFQPDYEYEVWKSNGDLLK